MDKGQIYLCILLLVVTGTGHALDNPRFVPTTDNHLVKHGDTISLKCLLNATTDFFMHKLLQFVHRDIKTNTLSTIAEQGSLRPPYDNMRDNYRLEFRISPISSTLILTVTDGMEGEYICQTKANNETRSRILESTSTNVIIVGITTVGEVTTESTVMSDTTKEDTGGYEESDNPRFVPAIYHRFVKPGDTIPLKCVLDTGSVFLMMSKQLRFVHINSKTNAVSVISNQRALMVPQDRRDNYQLQFSITPTISATLTLTVTEEMEGEYICQVRSKFGTLLQSASTSITVGAIESVTKVGGSTEDGNGDGDGDEGGFPKPKDSDSTDNDDDWLEKYLKKDDDRLSKDDDWFKKYVDNDGDSDSTTTAKNGLKNGFYGGWDANSDTDSEFGNPIDLNNIQSVNTYTESPRVDTDNWDSDLDSNYEEHSTSMNGGYVALIVIISIIFTGLVALRCYIRAKRCERMTGSTVRTRCRVLTVTAVAAVPTETDSDRVGLIAVRHTRILHV